MPSIKRRGIVINTKEWTTLQAIAKEEETSAGSIVRQAIHDYLKSREEQTGEKLGYDPIKDVITR